MCSLCEDHRAEAVKECCEGTPAEDRESMQGWSLQLLRTLFVKEGFQEKGPFLESRKSSTAEKPRYTRHRKRGNCIVMKWREILCGQRNAQEATDNWAWLHVRLFTPLSCPALFYSNLLLLRALLFLLFFIVTQFDSLPSPHSSCN